MNEVFEAQWLLQLSWYLQVIIPSRVFSISRKTQARRVAPVSEHFSTILLLFCGTRVGNNINHFSVFITSANISIGFLRLFVRVVAGRYPSIVIFFTKIVIIIIIHLPIAVYPPLYRPKPCLLLISGHTKDTRNSFWPRIYIYHTTIMYGDTSSREQCALNYRAPLEYLRHS